jgi:hypothetical protein
VHYEGSERTVDGAGKGANQHPPKSSKVPIITSAANHMSYNPPAVLRGKPLTPKMTTTTTTATVPGSQDEPIVNGGDGGDSGSDADLI